MKAKVQVFLAERKNGVWDGPLETLRGLPEGTQLYAVLPSPTPAESQINLNLEGEDDEQANNLQP